VVAVLGFQAALLQAPLAGQTGGPGFAPRARDNLIAFARLYGYIRYFHPSEASQSADWSAIAVEGARRVEPAETPAELARALGEVFAAVAPTVRIFESSRSVPQAPLDRPWDSAGTGIAYWNHYGVRTSEAPNIYDSRLTIVAADRRPPGVPEPTRPYRLELPGGVIALVPGSLFMPLPADSAARSRRPVADTALARFSAADRAVRFAAVIVSWNVVQHFYPYFEVHGVDWPAALRRALEQAAHDTDPDGFERTLKRMMAELRDGHAGANIQPWRAFGGPPLSARWIENQLVVTAVDSTLAGQLAPGDVIVRVNGEPVEQAVVRLDSLASGATQASVRFVSVITMLGGPLQSDFVIDVGSDGSGPARTLKLKRALQQPVDEPRPVSGDELQPGIRYFDLTRANDSLFQALLPQLASARGVVFDLRGYPRVQPRSLRHLVADTTRWGGRQMSIPTVLRPDREKMTFSFVNPWVIPPAVPRITGSIVFLTDERAGSYGESLLDLIEEHHLGVIVGSPSAGTNGNNNPFLVPGGYRVSFTGMRVVRHDGSRLHGAGVVPSVLVRPTIAGIRAGRDEVMEKGLEVIGRGAR
jgi:hypothetical protein